jgi:hypothetical protein
MSSRTDLQNLDLPALLHTLEERLRAAGALITEHWRPGADRERVEQGLASVGLQAPDEVVIWFGWHDGTDSVPRGLFSKFSQEPENCLLGRWLSLTMEQAVARREADWEIFRDAGLPDVDEIDTWFPLLVFGGTPTLCVDCGGDPAATVPVYINDPQGGDTPASGPRYPSLAHFVAEAIWLFDEGLTEPDPDRPGVVDVDRHRAPNYW